MYVSSLGMKMKIKESLWPNDGADCDWQKISTFYDCGVWAIAL